jgi:predicted nucleic acid-binding protein
MPRNPVLVDSSIWIDQINEGHPGLNDLLRQRRVLMHPMVYTEIALGSITRRKQVLEELRELPHVAVSSHSEVLAMIEWMEIYNAGIGYVDTHLLAAAKQASNCLLWTKDKRLLAQAKRFDIAYSP